MSLVKLYQDLQEEKSTPCPEIHKIYISKYNLEKLTIHTSYNFMDLKKKQQFKIDFPASAAPVSL